MADKSSQVGGIAGYNKGTVDQVFTYGIAENAEGQRISGASSVGGLIGENEGILTNGYTAGQVEITGNTKGFIAGTNKGSISYVYGQDANGLIGGGQDATAGYGLSDTASDYNGFNFTGNGTQKAIWKLYEGHSNPLLKLFLTTVTIDTGKLGNLVYDGTNHTKISDLLQNGVLTSQKYYDKGMETEADTFLDYGKNNSLLQSSDTTHAGTYANWLWSGQIGANVNENADFNPNVLGYDFDIPTLTVAKRTLSLDLGDVKRTYGDTTITGWDPNKTNYWDSEKKYGFDIVDTISGEKITESSTGVWGQIYTDLVTNKGLSQSDGALADGKDGRRTQDAGTYTWSLSGILNNADYAWKDGKNQFTGNSYVEKAKLTIDLNEVHRIYGDSQLENGSRYGGTVVGNVNGDTYTWADIHIDGIQDGALTGNGSGKITQNVGNYTWIATVSGNQAKLNQNYDMTVKQGTSVVDKAQLGIKIADAETTVGKRPTYGYQGTNPQDQLKNGDTYDFIFGGEADNHLDTPGTYTETIGVKIGDTWYYAALGGEEAGLPNFFHNYSWTIDAGTLHVKEVAPKPPEPVAPDIPKNPEWRHWDYLFHDAPWDKEWNERERKAEIHFISGGMRF